MTQADLTLTDSQIKQLNAYIEEKGHAGSIKLRPAPNLGGGYVELILLGIDGEDTASKRVLFPA
jgi:hypothetical protein